MKLTSLFVLILASALVGCGKNDSGAPSTGPVAINPNFQDLQRPELSPATHRAEDCPRDVEGIYEGQTDSGLKVRSEFFRRGRKGSLYYKTIIEGSERYPLLAVVDGQKNTYSGVVGFLSMGCFNNSIISINEVRGLKFEGKMVFNRRGFTLERISPGPDVKHFKRISRR